MSPRPVIVGNPDPVFRALRSRRTWMLAFVGAVLGASAGIVWVLATPPTYKATVAVELTEIAPQVNVSGIGRQADPVSIDTDAQIVSSDAVVEAVADVGSRSPQEVRDHLTISARPLTQVMTITYAAGDRNNALTGAETAANTFLSERDKLIMQPVRDYLTTIVDGTVSNDIVAQGGSNEVEANLWRLELRRQAALNQILELQTSGLILEQARITSDGGRGDLEIPIATGIGLGVLGGVAVAVARDSGRRRWLVSDPGWRTAWS